MQHNPGPWTIIRTASAHVGERAIIDGEGYTVCNPSPMGEANARLIAAAPALLAALAELVAEWDARHADEDHKTGYTLDTGGVAMARAAIAQAVGDA